MTADPDTTDGFVHPGLIKAPEAARLLGICPRLLWSLTNAGEIPHFRIPGHRVVRYDRIDLERWIEERKSSGSRRR